MQTTHLWYKFRVYSLKIILCWVAFMGIYTSGQAQILSKWSPQNLPDYDYRKITYGFQIGLGAAQYRVRYSEAYVSQIDTLHSVVAPIGPAFTAGFRVNYRLGEYFSLSLSPQATFYQYRLIYRYTNKTTHTETIEPALLELPLHLKYASMRRGNVRMYMFAGITPAFRLATRKSADGTSSTLNIRGQNLIADAGLGIDFYYPFFKMSVEGRFSQGFVNLLRNSTGTYGAPITSLQSQLFAIYLIFQ